MLLESLVWMTHTSWVTTGNGAPSHCSLQFPSNLGLWAYLSKTNALAMQQKAAKPDFLLQVTTLNGATHMRAPASRNPTCWFCGGCSVPIKELKGKVETQVVHIHHSRPDTFNITTSLLLSLYIHPN